MKIFLSQIVIAYPNEDRRQIVHGLKISPLFVNCLGKSLNGKLVIILVLVDKAKGVQCLSVALV